MPIWLNEWLYTYANNPVVQAIFIALGTFIMEDPVTIGSGLLVAEGIIQYPVALIGLWVGIALGDFGLYLLGRFAGGWVIKRGWVSERTSSKMTSWFSKNLVAAILLSRFVPGMRLPTYVGAGIARASAAKFLTTAIVATLAWTLILLQLTIKLGEAFLPYLGQFRWYALGGLVFIILLVNIISIRRMKKKDDPDEKKGNKVVSSFEFSHPALFYIPVFFKYIVLSIKHGGMMLPMNSNPSIYSGGMIGESKSEILDLMKGPLRSQIAEYIAVEPSVDTSPEDHLAECKKLMTRSNLQYPLVAKPDMGQRGIGVRPVGNDAQLLAYLKVFPLSKKLILQRLIKLPHEAGVLYYRYPNEEKGKIFSVTLKELPSMIGDGKSTLRELILADDRARMQKKVFFKRHAEKLDSVLKDGEDYQLVFTANHGQGAVFIDGNHIITPALTEKFHQLACSIDEFYFGRFDVRYKDLDSLQRGENIEIIEVNGAGAESTNIWDSSKELGEAYTTLFEQFSILFKIGKINKERGYKPIKVIQFFGDFINYLKQASKYPETY